ncbi:permease-like cell division protein FtsX [Haloimpatiens massiliensis]|uniref:permease-like cell division protein FtsX n=1 Tax=Haloimpatiens massiliensis TaxID=1658110 RepID=UPI000C821AC0|nr:permease-like cell division protein FtsX [Haloimpatiens massiliensis]
MRINAFKYFIVDALKSLRRNKTVSLASMLTVAASLFLMGIFLIAILNVGQGVENVESQVQIKVILKDTIKADEKNNIENKLKSTKGVKEIEFESKAKALEKWKNQLGEENAGLAEGLEKQNPMPTSYIVKLESPENAETVVSKVKNMPGIEKIKDGRKIVNQIIKITKALKWIGIVLFIICLTVSLFLIGNTIKLTVYSRRREINIMKYVGATDWFIRWPFIIEGIIIGILGALLATIVLYYAYKFIYVKITAGGVALMLMNLITPAYVFTVMAWKFILGGILIGSMGSILSIRKFLQV